MSNEVLRRSVFPFIPLGEEPSLDGGFVELRGRTAVAHSPSLGVPLNSLGFFAFHYAASNVACLFARPRHLVIGIYLPLRTTEEDLCTIVKRLGEEARKYNVSVTAGQTATYYGLEIPLVTSTCFGESLQEPDMPSDGDKVMIIGAVGGEALWLKGLSEGKNDGRWRNLTPLPAALRLQEVRSVKLMHDISEGGVRGALKEVAEALNIRLDVYSDKIPYETGVECIDQDVLGAPTYGSLLAVVAPEGIEDVVKACDEGGYICSVIGNIQHGSGAYIDGEEVTKAERGVLDKLYGIFKP